MKRTEQTCQDRAKTWQPGSRSASESMGKALSSVFDNVILIEFKNKWTVILSNICSLTDSIHFTRLHESKRQHASTAKHQQKCSCRSGFLPDSGPGTCIIHRGKLKMIL